MATTQDFTDTIKDMMGAWPVDSAAMEEAWKASAEFGEKASVLALDAVGKTTDLSVGWTMETLGRMGDLAKAKPAATDYAQALADFASDQMTGMTDKLTAYGDIAKTYQTETFELIMSAGKDMAADATATMATAAKATEKAAEKTKAAATTTAKRTTAAAKKPAAAAAAAPAEAPSAPADSTPPTS